ncbi:MAG: DNA/RNA non-specific endonuclease [Bacteroidales bacterium]|nr:DNA/RNA non-specific endonuclease [Bacteroidales bacterium]
MNGTVYSSDQISGTSGNFTAVLSGLTPSTTYYYKAELDVWNPSASTYVTVEGEIQSFTTLAESTQPTGTGYLACYEIPAVEVSGTHTSGSETYDSGRKWYRYNTTSSNRAVATHTWTSNSKEMRNYTVMMDSETKSPVWCAFAMHAEAWEDNNVGRNDSWKTDPAFPSDWQQTGISGSYSKGHLCASNYRQTTVNQNKQTFYYTNQAPQWQTSFNDGVWNQLENAVKGSMPSGRDTLYVVVGTLFEDNNTLSGIRIPSHFYKCLMKCSFNASGEMTAANGCAYLFTNESHSGSKYGSFITSIDAIEERSGLNFFANVPKELQDPAENNSSTIF